MHNQPPEPLFTLRNAAMRIRDRRILEDTTWTINPGEHWVIIGPNGAGKTTLLNTIPGRTPVVAGHVHRAAGLRVNLVGPELYRRYLQDETRRRLLWSPVSSSYPVTTARMVIEKRRAGIPPGAGLPAAASGAEPGANAAANPGATTNPGATATQDGPATHDPSLVSRLAEGLSVTHLLDRPIVTLSTGEMRKMLLISAVADRPDLLLLDEPFDGLDARSREWFAEALRDLVGAHTTLVMATHRPDEVVEPLAHYAALRDGRLVETGAVDRDGGLNLPGLAEPAAPGPRESGGSSAAPERNRSGEPLIEFTGVTVRYGGREVLSRLDWVMRRGENWCISGPNGSGKTTLLNLISGDNLQAYSNNIRLFGRQRGTGESIWDIKHNIGYVTPVLGARHDSGVTVSEVVISGFFDSVGLYRRPTEAQVREFRRLAADLGIEDLANTTIDRLSSGQRALVLIARAVIKRPKVLILDEPCDGLDPVRRAEVLAAVERIGRSEETDLLYVTHRPEEIPACTTHFLDLGR